MERRWSRAVPVLHCDVFVGTFSIMAEPLLNCNFLSNFPLYILIPASTMTMMAGHSATVWPQAPHVCPCRFCQGCTSVLA